MNEEHKMWCPVCGEVEIKLGLRCSVCGNACMLTSTHIVMLQKALMKAERQRDEARKRMFELQDEIDRCTNHVETLPEGRC